MIKRLFKSQQFFLFPVVFLVAAATWGWGAWLQPEHNRLF